MHLVRFRFDFYFNFSLVPYSIYALYTIRVLHYLSVFPVYGRSLCPRIFAASLQRKNKNHITQTRIFCKTSIFRAWKLTRVRDYEYLCLLNIIVVVYFAIKRLLRGIIFCLKYSNYEVLLFKNLIKSTTYSALQKFSNKMKNFHYNF